MVPFAGLSPRQFTESISALRREGADPVPTASGHHQGPEREGQATHEEECHA